ncbi:Uncharacterized protein BP5553_05333 [Venustampulla echinocandica]|uniref:TM2 domain-containing protein n=1 Tax=Venustampulla echinocandica TaxID=2656787 RepID=A0A370TQV4_9HELO|nr:Uncharacterized protein BP5553_05333 [Venustampulla echinocandica]RDL37900.1 Uncharacterized protein BP5553_05333 [Venustampulla echinocandica]
MERQIRKFIQKHFIHILVYQVIMFTILFVLIRFGAVEAPALTKRWGGFDSRPTSNRCYAQERTATLLSYILGPLAVDQFYAHHWVLAVFKLLTFGGLGLWWFIDIILWIVGGVYGTPGCPGGYHGV